MAQPGMTKPLPVNTDGQGLWLPADDSDYLGTSVDGIRRRNLSAVLRMVHVHGPASRAELAATIGLNRSTISTLVGDLAARGLVRERPGNSAGLPGRPSPVVEARVPGATVLAIDIHPSSLTLGRIGLGGVVLDRASTDVAPDEMTIQALAATLARPKERLFHVKAALAVRAIGVAVPGIIRRDDGVVAYAPSLGWHNVPVAAALRETLGLEVPVSVASAAELATLAELTRGAGIGCKHFSLLWGADDVGLGVFADGRPVAGHSGVAAVVGHMPIAANDHICACGSVGCWQTEVGLNAILDRLLIEPTSDTRRAVDQIASNAARGDPRTLAALREAGRWLGVGLASLAYALDSERIVLGGYFARLHPFLVDAIYSEAWRVLSRRTGVDFRIVPGHLGADAALIGAAELALKPTLRDPTMVPVIRALSQVPR